MGYLAHCLTHTHRIGKSQKWSIFLRYIPPPRRSHWRHHDIAPDLIVYNSVTSACCKGESGLTIYKKAGWMIEI